MVRVDFIVPIRPDQQQVLHIRLGQQILKQIERGCIEPLQVVEEEGQGMFRPREDVDKSTKYQVESALRILWGKLRDRWLFPDDELQLWNQVDHEPPVRTYCLPNGIAPLAQLWFALAQKGTDKALKGLRQGGIRDVALVLVELTRRKKSAGRNKPSMEFIHHGRLADAGVSGDEHQLRPAAGHYA